MLEVENLRHINDMPNLNILKLRELPRITTLDWLDNKSLTSLCLQGMSGLKDYASLLTVKPLNSLIIEDYIDQDKLVALETLSNFDKIFIHNYYISQNQDYIAASPLSEKLYAIPMR